MDANRGDRVCHRTLGRRISQSPRASSDRLDRLCLRRRLLGCFPVAGDTFVRSRAFELEALIDQMGDLVLRLQPAVDAILLIEVLSLIVLYHLVLPEADSACVLTVQ